LKVGKKDEVDVTGDVNWSKYLLIDNPRTGIVKMIKKEDFYKELLIADFKHWEVYLHESQCYLGRSYIWAKRKDALDFFDMNDREIKEYYGVGKTLKKALNVAFKPDLYNYATLANVSPHLHTHVIPRYKTEREFSGIMFRDERWGKNYVPYDKSFKVEKEILFKIRDEIKRKI
jgi:diadenosine tetraphosphate (Ap4A) HIT family hydrolase